MVISICSLQFESFYYRVNCVYLVVEPAAVETTTNPPMRKKSKLSTLMASLNSVEPVDVQNYKELASKQWTTYRTLVEKHQLSWDDDPCLWWKRYGDMVPELQLMARAYLGIQATSCSSERLFSKAGFIVNRFRTSLKSDNVSMLTFLATNASE